VTREEYERQKRRLEAERQAGIELLDAALAAQHRALELVWLTTGEGPLASALPPLPGRPAGAVPVGTTEGGSLVSQDANSLASRAASSGTAFPASAGEAGSAGAGPQPAAAGPGPAQPGAPAEKVRSQQLWWDLWKVWPRLPEEFDTADLTRALGYVPHRGALHRHLEQVQEMGELKVLAQGAGRRSSRFRKLPPPAPAGEPV